MLGFLILTEYRPDSKIKSKVRSRIQLSILSTNYSINRNALEAAV